jgi:hypothetical protein
MIAHIVLFEPKASVTADERQAFLGSIRTAALEIPDIRQARIGKTLSLGVMTENRLVGQQYSYAAIFEFDDAAGLKSYLDHPVHDSVRALFWKLCESTMIADVELIDPVDEKAVELVN